MRSAAPCTLQISEGCRWELLLWQEAYNNESIALGGITVEIWWVAWAGCSRRWKLVCPHSHDDMQMLVSP